MNYTPEEKFLIAAILHTHRRYIDQSVYLFMETFYDLQALDEPAFVWDLSEPDVGLVASKGWLDYCWELPASEINN